MKTINFFLMIVLFGLTTLFTSCADDDDIDPDTDGDHAVVHEMIISVTDENNQTTDYEFDTEHSHDDDDDDGDDHEHVEMTLSANSMYTVELNFFNDEGENISNEVHADEHLVCLEMEDLNLTFTRTGVDENGIEVGFMSTWQTGDASAGELHLEIKHQSDKEQVGTEDCEHGTTDIEAPIELTIQ